MAKASSSKKQKKIAVISDHHFEINNNKKKKKNEVFVVDDNKIPTSSTKVIGKRKRRSVPRDSPSQRSSIYRGVTRHRWTGRYEAHLWDKNCWNDSQKKKGRQVYLGAYDDEAVAARAYDLAALKYWGNETILNFPLSTYEDEMKEMEGLSREEYIGSLRRKSSGFSRGVSKYRGVARHHHNGRWEARIGRVFGNKYLYLGTYATQEEAATAYDRAAIEYRGLNAVTNFDLSRYVNLVKPNESCEEQPSPSIINEEATKSIDSSSASTSTSTSTSCSSTSSTTTTTFLEHNNNNEQIHDQVGHAINIDDIMWSDELPSDCLSTLLGPEECNMLQFDSVEEDGRRRYVEGEGSCSNDIRNNGDDFFSDLNSFLCDFDVLVDEQVDL